MESGDFSQLLADRLLASLSGPSVLLCSPQAILEEARATSSCSDDPHAAYLALSLSAVPAARSVTRLGHTLPTSGGAAVGSAISVRLGVNPASRRPAGDGTAAAAPQDLLLPFRAQAARLDAVVLSYACPWPHCELLQMQQGGAIASAYAACFSVLLRIRACLSRLHASWLCLSKPTLAQRAGMPGGGFVDPEGGQEQQQPGGAVALNMTNMREVRMWHRQALHFVAALQQHVQGQLLGSCWQALEMGITSRPVDMAQMAGLHSDYLKQAMRACLLQPASSGAVAAAAASSMASDAVASALHACETFSVVCSAAALSRDPPEHASAAGRSGCSKWHELLSASHGEVDVSVRAALQLLKLGACSEPGLEAVLNCAFYD